MDFEPIEGLEIRAFRLASIDLITPSSTSGDALLLCPDGRRIDLRWKSGQPTPSAHWEAPRVPNGHGVIAIEISEAVVCEADLHPVLEAGRKLVKAPL